MYMLQVQREGRCCCCWPWRNDAHTHTLHCNLSYYVTAMHSCGNMTSQCISNNVYVCEKINKFIHFVLLWLWREKKSINSNEDTSITIKPFPSYILQTNVLYLFRHFISGKKSMFLLSSVQNMMWFTRLFSVSITSLFTAVRFCLTSLHFHQSACAEQQIHRWQEPHTHITQ